MEPTFVIAGHLNRDYILPPIGRPLIDVPGGGLVYTASGLTVWETNLGLLARVGEDYPREWLHDFNQRGWDTRGVQILPKHIDLRNFQAYLNQQKVVRSNPMAHFTRLGLPFPKSLLNYQPPIETDDCKHFHPASPHPIDIPSSYLEARAAHLCPMEYQTHKRLLTAFQQAGITTITLDPSAAYMNPSALDDIRVLLQKLTVFIPSEEDLRALFWGKNDDLWEMAETLATFGCEHIIVKCGGRGQLLYDGISHKRWEIPAYPARIVDPTGVGDSFCGGFLVGFHQSYDALRAVLYGNVSASLAIEGSGAFHALEALPGLASARLESLTGLVRIR